MSANAPQIEYWNSEATRWWTERHEPVDRMFADITRYVLDTVAPQPGERVLDIGCATGTTVLALAERVGPDGHVLGADIAERSVARARERIAASGACNAEAIVADAAEHDFAPGGFDLIFSRFGVMFFVDPVAAFTNLRRALAPAGRFAAMAFRTPQENVWATGMMAAVRDLLPPQPPPDPEAPGQFAWADEARVRRILGGAGFRDITLTKLDPMFRLAEPGDAAGAAQRALTIGPVARIARELPEEQRRALLPPAEAYFRAKEGPDGVVLPAAIWLVRARP